MSMSSRSSEARPAPEEILAALREAGPSALAELLGDVDFLLEAIATDPQEMFTPGERPRGDFSDLLTRIHESRSSLEALEARTVVALSGATRRDQIVAARDDAAHEDEFVPPIDRLNRLADGKTARDYSLATRRSPSGARKSLASAFRLVRSMPRMLDSLATGAVTAQVAYAAASTAAPLDDGMRRVVDEILHERMPSLDGAGVTRWRSEVDDVIGTLDPDGSARRHRSARAKRHVTLTRGEHGMATLSANLPAVDAKLAHKRLSLEAERRRAEGAREGHSGLMADAFVDTLIGREGGMDPVLLQIGLVMTERALISPEHGDVAHIEGYGAVPVEAVREQLRAALAEPESLEDDRYGPDGPRLRPVLRRLFTHPTRGELVAIESRARAFPPELARFLSWRDRSCRAPYCDAPARHNDHIVPVSESGETSLDNGQSLCAHCNLHKESDTAAVRRIDDPEISGHLVRWTGFSGIERVSTPPRLGPTAPQHAAPAAPEGDEQTDDGPDDPPDIEDTDAAADATDAIATDAIATDATDDTDATDGSAGTSDVEAYGATTTLTRRIPLAEVTERGPTGTASSIHRSRRASPLRTDRHGGARSRHRDHVRSARCPPRHPPGYGRSPGSTP